MLPALRDIIETGKLGKEEQLDHPRKDGIVAFVPITKTVSFKGSPKEVEVLLGKDAQGNVYYDLFLDNQRQKKSPTRNLGQKPGLAGDSTSGATPAVELNIKILPQHVNSHCLIFDQSLRRMDENGYLHVASSALTKEQVAPYRGDEIPGWKELELDPERVYQVYRPAEELDKAAESFNGLPILIRHQEDSAWNPQKALRVGATGSSAAFDGTYIKNALVFHDAEAIELIESGKQKEISAGYRYTPVLQDGVFDGQPYELVMHNIRGNHVALVREGRAGPDVVVQDVAGLCPARTRGDTGGSAPRWIEDVAGLCPARTRGDRAKINVVLQDFTPRSIRASLYFCKQTCFCRFFQSGQSVKKDKKQALQGFSGFAGLGEVFLSGAEGGTRTRTGLARYPLKIVCLPVPPPRHSARIAQSSMSGKFFLFSCQLVIKAGTPETHPVSAPAHALPDQGRQDAVQARCARACSPQAGLRVPQSGASRKNHPEYGPRG